MPSPNLGAFGKMLFEKRMRERNMGQDPFGQFRMPTQEERLDEVMRLQKESPPTMFNRFREAIEGTTGVEKGMGSGAVGVSKILGAGFDNSALMQDPKFKQEDTMNQGMAVSEPYEEANEKAFEKNNPMNAISQETPVGDRVSDFLSKFNEEAELMDTLEPVAKQQMAKRKEDLFSNFLQRRGR